MAKTGVSAYNVVFSVLRLRECLIEKYQEYNMGKNIIIQFHNKMQSRQTNKQTNKKQ